MPPPSHDRIRQAIIALHAQDRASTARLAPDTPGHPTMYVMAAEALEAGRLPVDYWEMIASFHGLLALRERAAFADLLLPLLDAIVAHDGGLPYMLARACDEYLFPEDTWMVPPLLTAVNSVQAWDDATALSALSLLDDPRVDELLLALLRAERGTLQPVAVMALAERGAGAAVPPLMSLLSANPDPAVVSALGLLRAPAAVAPLLAIVAQTRAVAAETVDEWDEDADDMLDAREHASDLLVAAVDALGLIGDPRAIVPLAALLDVRAPDEDEDDSLALRAALALSRLGDPRAQPLLDAAATGGASLAVALRLMEMSDPRGVPAMVDYYQNNPYSYPSGRRDMNARHALLRDLIRSGTPAVIPFLRWVAGHDHAQTDQGWTLAEEAERAIDRILARERAFPAIHAGS